MKLLIVLLGIYERFNRYIVECKYGSTPPGNGGTGRFNRYIVECKFTCVIVLGVISSI